MQDLTYILMFLSLIGLISGLIGCLKGNIKLLNIKNRKQSGIVILASFIILIASAASLPEEAGTDPQLQTAVSTSEQNLSEGSELTDGTGGESADADESDEVSAEEPTASGVTDSGEPEPADSDGVPLQPDHDAATGTLQVHYIDVGQGASQLIISPNGRTMLIDAGNNDDEERVVAYLKDQGVSRVDILIVTHPDADHSGGADAVVDAFEIGSIYMPKVQSNTRTFESLLTSIANKNLKIKTAKAGIELDLDGALDIKMIGPVGSYRDTNNMSAVVRLVYGDTSFLFTGDAERESEQDMLISGATLNSDVLLVGHHGSDTSTSEEFLQAVGPNAAVIQVGDNNYGHPAEEVLSRLEERNVEIYRNDIHGNIIAESDGSTIRFNTNPWEFVPSVSSTPTPAPTQEPEVTAETPPQKQAESLTVTAAIDNPTPKQNASVTVTVQVKNGSGKPVSGADVELDLAYKSKNTVYTAVTDSSGTAVLNFKIGRAAKGFTVHGDITVRSGDLSAKAKTSFTPE